MDRAKILATLDVAHMRGLEFGPLSRPIIPRHMGPVEYVDRASREELQQTYGLADDVDPKDILEVDHVWRDQSLAECVGGRRGYLLSSHVIEHVPDLFGWLRELASVLEDGGQAVFVVPDKRYTFDLKRRTSGEAEIVEAYVRGLRRPAPRQVFDCFYNMRAQGAATVEPGAVENTMNARHLMALCQRIEGEGEYVDAHCWVFTPRSMVEVLDMGSRLGLLPFEIARLEPTVAGEADFLLVLRRLPDSLDPEARYAAFTASRDALDLPDEEAVVAEPPAVAPGDISAGQNTEEHEATARELAHARARLAAIERSTSWRLTRPLRGMATLLRRPAR